MSIIHPVMHYTTQSVGVYGVTGYAGSELLRLISHHPNFHLSFAQSGSADGKKLGDIFPLLQSERNVPLSSEPDVDGTDIVFMCLPAGQSMNSVPKLVEKGIRVVDLGPDYRLKPSSLFEEVYGRKHTDPDNLEQSTYGLTELNRRAISEAPVVANPGCYPTAALLAIAPVADIIRGPVIVDAKSGTSGAGREPTLFNNHSEIGENIRPYNANSHRHMPEITSYISAAGQHISLTFVPHLVPIVRGIEETIYLPGTPADEVKSRLSSFYSDSPFVHVVEDASLNMVQGTNHCLLQVAGSGADAIIFSYIDNLVKGASGQAIQNANVMSGLSEDAGLLLSGTGVGR